MTANDDQDDVSKARDLAESLTNLRAAIADSQQIIRAYDTKGQILAAFLAVFIGAVHLALTNHPPDSAVLCGQVATLSALVGILLIGAVLFPRSDPWANVQLKEYTPTRVFHPATVQGPDITLPAYVAQVQATRWLWELSFEMLKLASIRARKRLLLKWALLVTALTVIAGFMPLLM
jgi:hypothetical protein